MPYGIQIFLRSLYHRIYISGMGAGAKPQEPLDMVEINDTEDLDELSYLSSLIRRFRTSMLYERFGLSINEWLNMPKYLADNIVRDSQLESEKEAERQRQLERDQKKEEKNYQL